MRLDQIGDAIGIAPYYEEPSGLIYCADCLDVLPRIPEGMIDLILTDPPYGIGKGEWDTHYPVGIELKFFHITDRLIIMPGMWALPLCLKSIGSLYKGIIAGRNKNGMTFSPIGFGNWIPVIVTGPLKKGPDAFDFVVRGAKVDHPDQKPIDFMLKLIKRVSHKKEIILDPFLGSGTTAVAAKQLGRKFIGIEIEIEEKYCEIAVRRLAQEILL